MREFLRNRFLDVLDWWEGNWTWTVPVGIVIGVIILVFMLITMQSMGDTPIDKTAENMEAAEVADFGPVQVYRLYDRGAVCYLGRAYFDGNIAISCIPMASLIPDVDVGGAGWLREK